jgi:hypothetical protein
MLAKRRSLKLRGVELERTPLLVPSFSSKGFPEISKIVEYCTEIIEGPTLVSAYDLHYDHIKQPLDFDSLIFLDSGGYEASKDAELSDFADKEHIPREWNQEFHEAQLAKWRPSVHSVLISYDHPNDRRPLLAQIERAKKMAAGRTDVLREILLKPETAAQIRLQMEPILKNTKKLKVFDVIGVTEKEIGNSIMERMKNIARLRRALDNAGLDTPIHVFGSLDTMTTPMYFLAGADIFDGLTWLRFAFHEGYTMYKHNYGALKLGVGTPANVIDAQCWNSNYYYMKDMELEMRRFLIGGDFGCFKHHRKTFRDALQSVIEAVEV